MAYFLISTTGVVTLSDLGNRILPSGLSSVDIGNEFEIEELRYSADLASAIEAGTLEVVDDGRGRGIVGPVSNAIATAFVSDIYYYDDADVLSVIGNTTLEELSGITLSSPLVDGEALVYNGGTGEWENQVVTGGVSSVNTLTGAVVLDADDISDAATANKFVTAGDITNLGNLSGTNTGDQTSIVGITGNKTQFNTALTDGDFLYVGDAVTTIAAGSANYLSISSGELSISALAITSVSVFGTYTSLAAFIADEYTTGTEFQEGDTIILTATNGGTETYINNGGIANDATDFTLIQQPNIDQTTVRSWFSATAPLNYNSTTGDFALDIKDNGGLVIETNKLAVDLGASAITGILSTNNGGTGLDLSSATNGQLLIGNGSGVELATITDGDDIDVINGAGSITIGITDGAVGEAKLDVTNVGSTGEYLTKAAGDQFTWTTLPAAKSTWILGAGRNKTNVTNQYLRSFSGVPGNQSTYVAWFDCEIRAISIMTYTAKNWTGEVHVNGSPVATLASGGAAKAQVTGLSVSILAGDEVSFYCNGNNINRPVINALFEEV